MINLLLNPQRQSAKLLTAMALALPLAAAFTDATAQGVINLYSARHYQTDEALYNNFTAATGIKINRIEAGDEQILERLRSEGTGSAADVILLVDAARLWKAQIEGLFQPIKSTVLAQNVPAIARGKDDGQGSEWFGLSTRARVIVYNKARFKPEQISNYEDLANESMKGQVCTRSGSHPYMLSWIGSLSEHWGEQKTESWATKVVANFARKPRGGDTDQIKAVAIGECGVAVTNTYYWARLLRSQDPADKDIVSKVGMIWPNQTSTGAHVNIAGGAVAKNSPNRANAVKFLEYLLSPAAQAFFAEGNNEWPIVASVKIQNSALETMGKFKADTLPIAAIGRSQILAQKLVDRVGWR